MKLFLYTHTRKIISTALFVLVTCISFSQVVADTAEIALPPAQEEIEYVEEKVEVANETQLNKKNPNSPFTSSQRNVSDKTYKEIKSDDAFWYLNEQGKKSEKTAPLPTRGDKGESGNEKEPPKVVIEEEKEQEDITEYEPLGQRRWFRNLMLVLAIIGFACIVGWYLASSNVGLFRRKDVKKDAEVNEEDMPEDIFSINYVDEVDKAAAEGNYRLAIRLQYLRLLKNFAEKNIIAYKQDKTNFDYLSEMHGSSHYEKFFRITRHYEFSWYGKFEVGKEAYQLINADFSDLNKQLSY